MVYRSRRRHVVGRPTGADGFAVNPVYTRTELTSPRSPMSPASPDSPDQPASPGSPHALSSPDSPPPRARRVRFASPHERGEDGPGSPRPHPPALDHEGGPSDPPLFSQMRQP